MRKVIRNAAVLLAFLATSVAVADSNTDAEVEVLTEMLHKFLAGSYEAETHARFWADDLIYTSSNGTRFGKADIMEGMSAGDDSDEAPDTVYTGEDVQVQVYGTTAIVAFKLVGTPKDGSAAQNYFNTGTFLKRDGEWRVVAWQATIIPPPE
jgi:ketosteroid isomerase-like protein